MSIIIGHREANYGLWQDQLPYGMTCIQMSIHEYIRILATFEINIDKKLLKLEFFIDFFKIMPKNSNYLANYLGHTGNRQNVRVSI